MSHNLQNDAVELLSSPYTQEENYIPRTVMLNEKN